MPHYSGMLTVDWGCVCCVVSGTKMVHVGKNTRSRIVSKGISAGNSVNAYRGLVQIQPTARGESSWHCGAQTTALA